jgi:CubicO group peptidase (beta-lactamase class C family)
VSGGNTPRLRRVAAVTVIAVVCAAPAAADEPVPPIAPGIGTDLGPDVSTDLGADGDDDASSRAGGSQPPAAESQPDLETLVHPGRRLRYGSAREAGLVPGQLRRVPGGLRAFLQPSPTYPMYPGGVVLAARHGVIAAHTAAGTAVKYSDDSTELPPEQQVPARKQTIYDLASVSKTFTSIAVMQLVEDDRVDLDEPVATYLPAFAQNGKGDVTVRNLLTHTGGLPDWRPLYKLYDTPEERFAAVLAAEPQSPPGTEYVYSDFGMITLGLLVEEVTGKGLDEVVEQEITGPLGMDDTMYNPPRSLRDRIAATEFQSHVRRGMVHGNVHDENAWSLGGVSGHAGLFSTAHDMAVLAQTLLNGGSYGRTQILQPDTVRQMLHNENQEFPEDSHGLGLELDQRWYMDAMSTPGTFGHTGFTGTSMVVDPESDSFVLLLTNRVHPNRDWSTSNNGARRAVARGLARAVPVRPKEGREAWYSGIGDSRTPTLTLPLRLDEPGRTKVEFSFWYDTEAGSDIVTLEASPDGGETWRPVPFRLRSDSGTRETDGKVSGYSGRRWFDAAATRRGPGSLLLRWRYHSDDVEQGRGVYVDTIRVTGPDGTVLFDDSRRRAKERLDADGWEPSRD